MMELPAALAFCLDPFRPLDNRAVARAAPVRCHLLRPLIGRVHRVRPADSVVVVGIRAAKLVKPGAKELWRFERGHSVEIQHFVERAVQRALGRCAVIADDQINERVVQDVQFLQAIQQAPNVVVRVLHETRVDFHLPTQHGLERLGHLVPRWDFLVACGELAFRRDDSELQLASEGLLA